MTSTDLAYLAARPGAGAARPYDFPDFTRTVLPGGLTVVACHVPGRPLLSAQLIVRGDAGGGATSEPDAIGGVTALMAKAMTEGTARRDAIELIEASERLGAEIGADAGWDSLVVHVAVPRSRIEPALALLAEVALEPSFPEDEVHRLRDERLNDLRQAQAEPRRRAERIFPEAIYVPGAPYRRPLGGSDRTVPGIDRAAIVARHAAMLRPEAATFILVGDLQGIDAERLAAGAFGSWRATAAGAAPVGGPSEAVRASRRVLISNRPGAAQTEVRIGHLGLSRRTPDFHATSVMNAILGGLFRSRLNELLRETRGYTYGIGSTFDMRRHPGPFAVRCAVQTAVTAPAITDILGELERIRTEPVTAEELSVARDYLVGVFPLRFESAGQVAGALAGLVVQGLPDDELDRYRPAIAAVSADDVLAAARANVRPDEAAIVLVGDAAAIEGPVRDAGFGEVTILAEEGEPGGDR